MGYIRNLQEHRASLHPTIVAALDKLDSGMAPLVKWSQLVPLKSSRDGALFVIDCSYRSPENQDNRYEAVENGHRVTYLRGGESPHQWGLAVDIHLTPYGVLTGKVDGVVRDFSKPQVYKDLGLVDYFASCGIDWLGEEESLGYDVEHWELRINHPTDLAMCGVAWWNPAKVAEAEAGVVSAFPNEGKKTVSKLLVVLVVGALVYVGSRLVKRIPANWRLA